MIPDYSYYSTQVVQIPVTSVLWMTLSAQHRHLVLTQGIGVFYTVAH